MIMGEDRKLTGDFSDLDLEPHRGTYFSRRISAVRKSRGITIGKLVSRTGFSKSSIYRYEQGASIPNNLETWRILAEAHGMSLEGYMDALFGLGRGDKDGLEAWAEEVVGMIKKCPLREDSS